MNILLTSVGRRNLIVRYFVQEMKKYGGRVFVGDCSAHASALYEDVTPLILPRITDKKYVSTLLSLCKEHHITGILSLTDPELTLLAQHKDLFSKEGILCGVSNYQAAHTCLDKQLFYDILIAKGIAVIPTYNNLSQVLDLLEKKEIDFPLIIKPSKGSASIQITKVHDLEELHFFYKRIEHPIVQPCIVGEEWGVDCYRDFINKKMIGMFSKKKLLMRSGETDKAVSIDDAQIKQVCQTAIEALDLVGPLDVDCFRTATGEILLAEINPRIGGGAPFAYEAGMNFVALFLKNVAGQENEVQAIEQKKMYMFKHVDANFVLEKDIV